MADQFAELFANLRRGPWHEDPRSVIQETGAGNGNIESQGWLSDNSVSSDVIQASAVIASKISAGAVETDKLAANAVTAAKISAGAVETTHLAASAVTAEKISAGAVETDKLAANAVTAAKIAADTITANEIAASAITATELATDSVTTNKVLAANITSAKIELTISAKNFGANKGSLSAPGVFFDVDSTIGLTLNGTNTDVILGSGSGVGDPYFQVGPSAGGAMLGQAGDLFPGTDNSFSCGISGGRWLDVWAVDTTINSSDERLKKDIHDVPLGLDFVQNLRPVAYRWKDTVDTQARESVHLDEQELIRQIAPHERRLEKARAQQLAGEISDAEAEAVAAEVREVTQRLKDEHYAPWYEARKARRPGRRLHMGLVAQDVKAALDAAGIDAALYKVGSDGVQSLAYTELIAPLIRAVQELAARVETLESRGSG